VERAPGPGIGIGIGIGVVEPAPWYGAGRGWPYDGGRGA